MRYLDVCSGYSAATLAFAGFGWECVGYAEIDPFASGILAARHGATMPMRMPDPEEPGLQAADSKARATAIKSLNHYYWSDRIPNFGDFTTIGAEDVGPVQLLIGGTPCQSFSQAGKRHGLDDPRGNLTLEFLALAKRLRPRWLVWENVPGFLSHDGGRTPGTFFWLLGQLGYGWAYRVLDAQFIRVDGLERAVPQRRRRVFVVGCLGNPSAAAAVLFDPESLRGDPRPRRRAGQAVAGALTASSGKRGGVSEGERGGLIAAQVAPTLDASYGRLQGCSGQDLRHGHSHLVAARMRGHGDYVEDEIAGTLKARDRLGRETDLIMHPDVAAPLRAGGEGSGWRDDLDNGTFIPVVPEVAAPLTSSRQSSDDGAKTYIPFDTTQLTNPNNRSNPKAGDPCHSLSADAHPPCIAFPEYMSGTAVVGQDPEDVSTTLGATNPTAICVHGDAVGRSGKAKTPSADAEGRVRLRDAGLGVSEDAAFALTTGQPHAVAFKASHYTRDSGGAPSEVAPPLTADTDKGDQDTLLLAFSAKDAGQDVGEQVSPTLRSMGHDQSHANGGGQVAIAFQERGRTGGRNLEHQQEVAYALTSADQGGRRNELNVVAPEPFSFQARNGRGQPDTVAPALNGVGAGDTSDMRPLAAYQEVNGWSVRRLTPVECERLQGVPDSFTHIELKKRQRTDVPADLAAYWLAQQPGLSYQQLQHLCADSPRYRVLGNSFALPPPRWIGHGIVIVDAILRERGL